MIKDCFYWFNETLLTVYNVSAKWELQEIYENYSSSVCVGQEYVVACLK
jgi:hypothetical protein